jgi:polysaccharide pyruvyl transferase WcaK-like protein
MEPTSIEAVGLEWNDSDGDLVGLNLSGLLMMGGYNRNNSFGLAVDYAHLMKRIADALITKHGARVLLVPHVLGDDAESDVGTSRVLFEELRKSYPGRVGLLQGNYDQSEVKYVIGHCNLFIGARMHACIAAVSQGVPPVSIAYSDKFAGVMDAVGVAELVADPRRMSEEEIISLVEDAYSRRRALQASLSSRMGAIRSAALMFLEPSLGFPQTGESQDCKFATSGEESSSQCRCTS